MGTRGEGSKSTTSDESRIHLDKADDSEFLIWSVNLSAKEVIADVIGLLEEIEECKQWGTEVTVDNTIMTVADFMELDHDPVEEGGLVRFNTGPYPAGFSITIVKEGDQTEVLGALSSANFNLIDKVIKQMEPTNIENVA